jgi:hypothetical protein
MPAVRGYRYVDIVLLGSFNPLIFQPEWLRRLDILPAMETEAAVAPNSGTVLSQELASVRFASLHLEVVPDRWVLSTERPDWTKDLGGVVASLMKVLPHTPVSAFGVNAFEHRPTDGSVDELLKRWVPLRALGELAGVDARPIGTVTARWGKYNARLQFERSERVPRGVFVHQNFQLDLRGGVQELTERLESDWQGLLERSQHVVSQLIAEGTQS